MESPFPGMDPYLEARWSDVHVSLIACIAEALQPRLPASLRARAEERILRGVDDGAHAQGPPASVPAASEPIFFVYQGGPAVDRFVKIIDVKEGNRVVTTINVLSLLTKSPGRGNEEYRRRLEDNARDGASVVEIDLLRSPRNWLLLTGDALPPKARSPYLIAVRRGSRNERWEIYPVAL